MTRSIFNTILAEIYTVMRDLIVSESTASLHSAFTCMCISGMDSVIEPSKSSRTHPLLPVGVVLPVNCRAWLCNGPKFNDASVDCKNPKGSKENTKM